MPSLQFTETGEVAIAMRRFDSLVTRRRQMNVSPRICGQHNH